MRIKALPPFVRNCPLCNKLLEYTTVKHRNRANKNKVICHSCRATEIQSRPSVKAAAIARGKTWVGAKNGFFGKKHSAATIALFKNRDTSYTQTEEFRKKSARHGSKNGMYGKTVYEVWVKKYGEKEAQNRFILLKKKQSENSSGKNNPMYGKPSPHGSGGGWGGWYKNWYFRSLRELSYMINVIEKKKLKWSSGESNGCSIKYTNYDGKQRTYRPDFLIEEKILLEIKPKKLMETPNNILKRDAAIIFCKEHNLQYRMVDVKILDLEILVDMFNNGLVKFNKKYTERMVEICDKMKKKN